MSRIKHYFNGHGDKPPKTLIPFITAGDPKPSLTVSIMHELVNAGANIIELGVPFSDPMADGPVIQRASERALAQGTSLSTVLDIVSEFRQQNQTTPVILMGYMNSVEAMGYVCFSDRAAEAGVDGILLVDLPIEYAHQLHTILMKRGIDQIFLVSPTTSEQRLLQICQIASGFLYYVSLKGVTGAKQLNLDEIEQHIQAIRRNSSLPIGVGFGIKDADSARAVINYSDAVIVGSSLVEIIAQYGQQPKKLKMEVHSFIATLRKAIDTTL